MNNCLAEKDEKLPAERVHPKKVVGHAARLSDLRSQKS